MPPIAFINILNDLFTTLVLEVDVDIGWLIAFGTDETGEQGIAVGGVDSRNAQAIADR